MKTSVERQINGVAVRVEYDEDKFRLYVGGREAAYGYAVVGRQLDVMGGSVPLWTARFIEENAVWNEPAVVEQELDAAEAEEEEQEDGVAY